VRLPGGSRRPSAAPRDGEWSSGLETDNAEVDAAGIADLEEQIGADIVIGVRYRSPRVAGTSMSGSDGTRTRDLRRDRPAL
jgi:hypothetical protein